MRKAKLKTTQKESKNSVDTSLRTATTMIQVFEVRGKNKKFRNIFVADKNFLEIAKSLVSNTKGRKYVLESSDARYDGKSFIF